MKLLIISKIDRVTDDRRVSTNDNDSPTDRQEQCKYIFTRKSLKPPKQCLNFYKGQTGH